MISTAALTRPAGRTRWMAPAGTTGRTANTSGTSSPTGATASTGARRSNGSTPSHSSPPRSMASTSTLSISMEPARTRRRSCSCTAGRARSSRCSTSCRCSPTPGAHGGDPADSFDVVIASLPGFGYSDRPTTPGMSVAAMAPLFHALMTETLGYGRYAIRAGRPRRWRHVADRRGPPGGGDRYPHRRHEPVHRAGPPTISRRPSRSTSRTPSSGGRRRWPTRRSTRPNRRRWPTG